MKKLICGVISVVSLTLSAARADLVTAAEVSSKSKPAAPHHQKAAAQPAKKDSLVSIKTMAFPIANGLYINVNVTNRSLAPLRLVFPSSARVEVKAMRDGCMLWDSLAGRRFTQNVTTLLLQGEQIDTFSEFWPLKPGDVSGKITLQARLLSTNSVQAPPIVIDFPQVLPVSPNPNVQPTPSSLCATPLPGMSLQTSTLPTPTSIRRIRRLPQSQEAAQSTNPTHSAIKVQDVELPESEPTGPIRTSPQAEPTAVIRTLPQSELPASNLTMPLPQPTAHIRTTPQSNTTGQMPQPEQTAQTLRSPQPESSEPL